MCVTDLFKSTILSSLTLVIREEIIIIFLAVSSNTFTVQHESLHIEQVRIIDIIDMKMSAHTISSVPLGFSIMFVYNFSHSTDHPVNKLQTNPLLYTFIFEDANPFTNQTDSFLLIVLKSNFSSQKTIILITHRYL